MFSNDLVIPTNFISLENYKTKTNPQTTLLCNKLCVDDPFALLLGQWPRLNLSQNENELEMDSTFSSFMNSTVCSSNEDESINETSKKTSMIPLVLPEPKNDSSYTNTDENSFFNTSCSFITVNDSKEELSNGESNEESTQSQSKQYYFIFYIKIVFILDLYFLRYRC